MKVLNYDSLFETMIRCVDNNNYKSIIVFKNLEDERDFAKELAELHRDTPIPGIDRVFIGGNGARINFKNGSRIETINTSTSRRGNKCNEVIYNNNVDIENEHVFHMLQSMLVPYKSGAYECIDGNPSTDAAKIIDGMFKYARHKGASQRSDELDEFLGSFSIVE